MNEKQCVRCGRAGHDSAECKWPVLPAVGSVDAVAAVLACEIEADVFEQHVVPALEVARKVAAEQAQQADDADAEWRRLALQFDGHRMQALAHLRCLLENHEGHADAVRAFLAAPPLSGEQVLNDRTAAMYQSTDDWQPSGIEYDRSIHGNPDAGAWAKFFVETFPALKGKEGLMLGWFANAMMAMRDYLQTQPPAVAVPDRIVEAVMLNITEAWRLGQAMYQYASKSSGKAMIKAAETEEEFGRVRERVRAMLAAAQKGGA